MPDTHFAVAIHILTLAIVDGEEPVTSRRAAASVGTNPAFIRRIVGRLAKAGLVDVQMGPLGGVRVLKPANKTTLLDVYRAMDADDLLRLHASMPSDICFVGRSIIPALKSSVAELQQQFEAGLSRITLADVANNVLTLAGRPRRTPHHIGKGSKGSETRPPTTSRRRGRGCA
jgi:DNA-binding IscR family transcriptional regulator